MNAGKTLSSQLMDCLPWSTFTWIVARHHGDYSVLVARVRKRLKQDASFYTLMQVLSVTAFEMAPIESAIFQTADRSEDGMDDKQSR
jgi:hypothetical protein